MGIEIERKFLLKEAADAAWKIGVTPVHCLQGYLALEAACTVRVRVAGERAFLTVKSAAIGATRQEFEYAIPCDEALEMLRTLAHKPLIEKYRYVIPHGGLTWEVDEFLGENHGLIIAEVELESEDQSVDKPAWVGREVTGDSRYYNSTLVDMPYSRWEKE